MAEERAKLRAIFDEAALLYDEVRPGYPEELFDDIVALSGIPSGGRILEIGCGTGQATVPFARRGYRILCVELGKNLAAVAPQPRDVSAGRSACGTFRGMAAAESALRSGRIGHGLPLARSRGRLPQGG
jgi:SAM-dependent methyltransferase